MTRRDIARSRRPGQRSAVRLRQGCPLSTRLRTLVALALAAAPLAVAGADVPPDLQDPLGVRVPGTLRDLFLDVVAWDAREIPAPRLDVGWVAANDWSTPTTLARGGQSFQVRLDEQADSLAVALRVPWGVVLGTPPGGFLRRLATAVELRATVHWGGWMDAPIEAWHRAFSYDAFARPAFPRNEVHLALHDDPGTGPVAIDGATFAFGDVVLRNQLLLWQGGEPLLPGPEARAGVSLRLDLKIPTGSLSRMGGSGGWDVGVALLGTWQAADWIVGHAIASGSFLSPMAGGAALQPRTWQASVGLSLVLLPGGPWAILLEDRWTTSAFQWGWGFVEVNPEWNAQSSAWTAVSMPQNQISAGVRLGPVTAWFTEDFTPGSAPGLGPGWFYDTNAPDLAIGLTLTLRP